MNIDGKTYCFDKSGWMRTGWAKTENTWHYFTKSGVMTTGWQKVSGKWYYLDQSGADEGPAGRTSTVRGACLNSSGAMKTGWLKQGGAWYYLKGSGVMATGWQKASGKSGITWRVRALCRRTSGSPVSTGSALVVRWRPIPGSMARNTMLAATVLGSLIMVRRALQAAVQVRYKVVRLFILPTE